MTRYAVCPCGCKRNVRVVRTRAVKDWWVRWKPKRERHAKEARP